MIVRKRRDSLTQIYFKHTVWAVLSLLSYRAVCSRAKFYSNGHGEMHKDEWWLPCNELSMSSLWWLGMCETFFPWVRDFITFPMAVFHCNN